MKSVESSADAYICHVADAPPSHQKPSTVDDVLRGADAYRFPPPSENASHRYSSPHAGVDDSISEEDPYYAASALRVQPSTMTADADEHSGAATLIAAETYAPSSPIPPPQQRASAPRKGNASSTPVTRKAAANANVAGRGLATSSQRTGGAADPFISPSSTEAGDDDDDGEGDRSNDEHYRSNRQGTASPGHPSSPTLEGVPTTKATAKPKATIHAAELPRRVPQPPEDRVRGYSVLQDSAATPTSQPSSRTAPQESERGAAAARELHASETGRPLPPLVSGSKQARSAHTSVAGESSPTSTTAAVAGVPAGAEPSRPQRASTPSPTASNSNAGNNGALVPAETAADSSSVATYTRENSLKELVSHVDHNSYGFELREALQAVDFPAVYNEYRQNSSVESKALQECRHLFRVLAKNKDAMSAEDVYDLLVLFTPCGASYREGLDFLWENCEGKSSLSFEHFLFYGPRLRARLRGYELFSQLRDQDKLVVTHHRVLPGEPPRDANAARVHLLQLADEQLQGAMRPHTRPLRLYEELFLVEYQEMLYEAALIPASEVPQRMPDGDFAHDASQQQRHTLPQLSVPVLQRESTDWRADNENDNSDGESGYRAAAAADSPSPADRRPYVVAYDASEASSQVSPVHRDANRSGRGLQPSRPPMKGSGRGPANSKKGASTARTANACYSLYNPDGSRSARNGESLAVTLQGRPRADMRKNLGRFVEEEYWERRTLDDHLITQLQNMYSTH